MTDHKVAPNRKIILFIGASSNYTGVVMSAFSFAGLVAAPLFGKWTDHLGKSIEL